MIYLPENEIRSVVKRNEYWRTVRLDLSNSDYCVCFLHEREWRCKGNYRLPKNIVNVMVKTEKEKRYIKRLLKNGEFPARKYNVFSLEDIEDN